jgi:hypothetical protein
MRRSIRDAWRIDAERADRNDASRPFRACDRRGPAHRRGRGRARPAGAAGNAGPPGAADEPRQPGAAAHPLRDLGLGHACRERRLHPAPVPADPACRRPQRRAPAAGRSGGEIAIHPYHLHAPFACLPEFASTSSSVQTAAVRVRAVLAPSAPPETGGRIRDTLVRALEAAGAAAPAVTVEPVAALERDGGHARSSSSSPRRRPAAEPRRGHGRRRQYATRRRRSTLAARARAGPGPRRPGRRLRGSNSCKIGLPGKEIVQRTSPRSVTGERCRHEDVGALP